MLHGSAPVCVHEIFHALASSYSGTRPRPVRLGLSLESGMQAVPVTVVIRQNGDEPLELYPCRWVLVPYLAANNDPEKASLGPEQAARLAFFVKLPEGYRLVRDYPPGESPEEMSEAFSEAANVSDKPRIIPELEGVDPAVFATDPEKLMKNLRALSDRPAIGSAKWNQIHGPG